MFSYYIPPSYLLPTVVKASDTSGTISTAEFKKAGKYVVMVTKSMLCV